MTNPHNLTIGQELWFVPERYSHLSPRNIKVKKIGRIWAETSTMMRISLDTLVADGGQYSPPGRCYLSRDAWEAEGKRQIAWGEIRHAVGQQHTAPKGFDAGSVNDISRLLGVYIEGAKWPPVRGGNP